MLGGNIRMKQENTKLGIGIKLRNIRQQMNLSISKVANLTGIAEETIRRIELDKFEPKISTLEILSDFYRIDIIELFTRTRKNTSMFSVDFISRVNELVNLGELEQLHEFADCTLQNLKDSQFPNKNIFLKFLYALKHIKYDPTNGQNDTIAYIEDILVQVSPTYLNESEINYPFPIEVSFILLLAIMYRQNSEFDKAIAILKTLIIRIHNMPIINDRFSDYLASAYLNLAYTYHSLGNNELVISTVDECLDNIKVSYTKISLSHLLFRKGLALHFIKDTLSYSLLITSLSMMDITNQDHMKSVLKNKYDIDIHL